MTREAWGKFANPSGAAAPDVPPAEVAEPSPEGTTLDLAAAVMRGDVLGDRFSEVQAIVNQRAGVGAARVYTVKSGDTLSEIGASLGIDWHTIASKNGIGAPYTIYPGQKLSY